MQRRGGNEQPVKGQRRSGNKPKARNAPTAQVSGVDLQEQLDRRTRERDEALEQLAATSEVLKVISSSPGELELVFNAMLENATRICEAKFGTLYRYDGGAFYPVTFHKVPSSLADFIRKRGSFVPPSGTPLDRLLRTKEVIRTADDSAAEIPESFGPACGREVAYCRAHVQRRSTGWRHRHLTQWPRTP